MEGMVAKVCGVKREELKERRCESHLKGIAGMMLVKYTNLTQREASDRLGLTTGSGVSYQIRKVRKQMLHDERVKRWIAKITNMLDSIDEKGR